MGTQTLPLFACARSVSPDWEQFGAPPVDSIVTGHQVHWRGGRAMCPLAFCVA